MSDKLRPVAGLDVLPRYVAGKHELPNFAIPIILSANENPRGSSPKVLEALRDSDLHLHRYPDGNSQELKEAIVETHQLDTSYGAVILGAGSDEILSLLAQGFAPRDSRVLMSQYGFAMYPLAAQSVGAVPHSVPERDYCTDIDALLVAVTPDTRMIFLANPNNPTGSYVSRGEIMRLIEALPEHVLLVLDCAYSEYVEEVDYSSHHDQVASGRVAVTHTFSKAYGLAALRLGWAFVPPMVADIYERLRSPFNLTAPSIAAGLVALSDREYLAETVALNRRERDKLIQGLGVHGITVLPSVGNFLLLDFGRSAAVSLAEKTLAAYGIIVRNMAGYGLPHCLRLSIGLPEENSAVLEAFSAMKEHG